jgi:ribonuclease P protein component
VSARRASSGSQGFGPDDRVRRRKEFLRIYAEGRRVGGPGFVLFYRAGATGRHRLGVTVPKRVGGAVTRNRIRRRLREVFRRSREALGERALDIVVNVIARDIPKDREGLETSFVRAAAAARSGKGRPPRAAGPHGGGSSRHRASPRASNGGSSRPPGARDT